MKTFNRNLGYLAIIFFVMIIASVSVASSYMRRNDISFIDLFEGTTHIQFDDNFDLKLNSLLNDLEKSSHFDTKVIEKTSKFEPAKELFVSSSIEEIVFIEEDRDNIQIDYYRELPDSKYYTVDYNADSTKEKITVSASMSVKNLAINSDYKGSITIHVPKNYIFDKITIDSGISKLKDSNIYLNTKDLTILSSLGDVKLEITKPLETLHITSNLGSVNLDINSTIDKVMINCDLGKIDLTVNDPINILTLEENMGDIKLISNANINFTSIHNNMGRIDSEFNESVGGSDFYSNIGSIDVTFSKNKDISVFAKTSLGKVSSDFPTTEKDKTNYKFESDMGSISIEN